jgi:sulfatase modifying factor 1
MPSRDLVPELTPQQTAPNSKTGKMPNSDKLSCGATGTSAKIARKIIWIDGGRSHVGTSRPEIAADGEGPIRKVSLAPYGLSSTAVTNAEFAAFVADTGYLSEAHKIGWSFVFRGLMHRPDEKIVPGLPWWNAVEGATWESPRGPGSTWQDIPEHPVVQVSHNDALAFARWSRGRLPTEAEWEHAARGGPEEARYPWGASEPNDDTIFCNIWQGQFPEFNTKRDGYYATSPVEAFRPNKLGFYNMAGNVWEWCADPFKIRSVSKVASERNAHARHEKERIMKGGSFLCHASYCWRYRIAARTGRQPDNAASHVGFRIAFDART